MGKKDEEFYTARGYENAAGKNTLTPSMEDYLEMIIRLSNKTGYTRVNDLANSLNVQPPSVSKMVQKLKEEALLDYEKYGMIHLTEEGRKLGEYLLNRHNTLKEFFTLIQATKNLQKDVETIEHYISVHNYRVIAALVGFMKENEDFLNQFYKYKERFFLDES